MSTVSNINQKSICKGAQDMKKLEQIDRQEQKAREKIAALQEILKDIGKQRTEQEDLQIIQKFRAMKLSRDELYLFLGGGELPPVLTEALKSATAAEPEVIHSERGKKRRKGQSVTAEGESESSEDATESTDNNDNPSGDGYFSENTNFESEV
jgi:hypothetical protein